MKAVECCLNDPIYFANRHRTWLMSTCSSGELKISSIQLYFFFFFYKEGRLFCEVKKKRSLVFPTEKWHKYYWTANIWSHLSLFWTGKKIKIIPERVSLMLVGKWRGWHGRSFPWLKTFHFHIALPQIEHLSLFSFCIWLSSVPNLKEKNARIPFSLWSVSSEGIKTFPTLWQATFKGHHREKDSKFIWEAWVITQPLTKVWQKSVLSRSIYMITRKFGEIKFSGVARADAVGNNFHINQRWTEGCPFAF